MKPQTGGGSVGQSLQYVDPTAPERSAAAGTNLLVERGLIARPAIGGATRKRRGGFLPSIMSGVVDNAIVAAPLAAIAARKLLNKTRRGGSKANLLRRDRAIAKDILLEIGRPTAQNIIKFTAARRSGKEAEEFFLAQYRERKVRQAEEESRKRIAQQAKKAAAAAKKAQQEAAKAARKAAREAKKAAKEAAAASRKRGRPKKEPGTAKAPKSAKAKAPRPAGAAPAAGLASAKPKRTLKKATAAAASAKPKRTLKKATAAAAAAASSSNGNAAPGVAAPAVKKERKPATEAQKAYFEALREARTRLGTFTNKPKGPNMAKWASLKLSKKETAAKNLEDFETEYKTRGTAAPAAAAAAAANSNKPVRMAEIYREAEANKARAAAASSNGNAAPAPAVKKEKKPISEAQKAYFEALREARTRLGTFTNKPKGPNMAKWASLKLSKKETAAKNLEDFETEYKTRGIGASAAAAPSSSSRRRTVKTAKKARTTAAPARKPLSTVAEEKENNNNNNNENNMQGYSENFDPEPENK